MDSASNRPGGLSPLLLAIRTFAHSSATNSGHPSAASTSVETSTLAPSEKLLLPVSNTSNIRYSSCASITLAVKKDCLFQSPPCCKPPSPPLSRIASTANIISTQAVMMNARFFIFRVPSHNKLRFVVLTLYPLNEYSYTLLHFIFKTTQVFTAFLAFGAQLER